MVKIKIENGIITELPKGSKEGIYYDGYLYNNIMSAKHAIKKDLDMVFLVDGYEGCLTGDTIINVNRCSLGRQYRLDYMFKQFHNNKEDKSKVWNLKRDTFVRSFDGTSIKLHKIKDVVYSGIKEVFELELVNGKKIKATADHKIMTKKGFIELQNLTTKDEIMCDTLLPQKGLKKSFKLKDPAIKTVYHPYKNVRDEVEVHRLIYEANINKLRFNEYLDVLWNDEELSKELKFIDPKIYHVHHEDGNHYNNSIENLKLLKIKDHLLLHSKKDESFRNFNQGIPVYVKIKSRKFVGSEKTYDICCDEPHHNFVANGIVVHNSGKSVMAQQVAKLCDPSFDIDRIVFTAKDFSEAIDKANKYEAIVYDEAYGGLSSRAAMSEVNRGLVSMLAEIRQKNLYVFIVMPCFFEMDKYASIWRSRVLIHVYMGKGFERGFFGFYSSENKKTMYLLGKKTYKYCVKPDFKGRFGKGYVVDEDEYRKKKLAALRSHAKKEEDADSSREASWIIRHKPEFDILDHLIDKYNLKRVDLFKLAKFYGHAEETMYKRYLKRRSERNVLQTRAEEECIGTNKHDDDKLKKTIKATRIQNMSPSVEKGILG